MTDPCGREMVGPHLGRGQDIDGEPWNYGCSTYQWGPDV